MSSQEILNYNPYGYIPSRSAAAAFIGLYGLSTTLHIVQTLLYKRRVWWTLVFTAGGIMEILGWVGRLQSSFDVTSPTPYLMQIITLIIAPAWFSAGCYAVTGALIHRIGQQGSHLSARAYTALFVVCDCISIALQGVGGATAGKEADRGESPEKGRAIMLAGIVFQLASMCLFLLLSVQFYKKRWSDLNRQRRKLVWATMFASLCIIVRGIFRTTELGEGWKGFLFVHEIFTIDLDGFPIILCMLAFNVVHPGATLDGEETRQLVKTTAPRPRSNRSRPWIPTMLVLFQLLLLWSIYVIGSLGSYVEPTFKTYRYTSQPVTISHLFDNVATRDFDGNGRHYPKKMLPKGVFTNENVNFSLPNWGEGRPDNVIANEQTIHVDMGHIREFHILYAGDWIDGETGSRFTFGFKDWSSQSVEVSVKNWWNLHWLNSGPIQLPYHNQTENLDFNVTQIHHWSTQVDSRSPLRSIHFPPKAKFNSLHVFAISLVPAVDSLHGASEGEAPLKLPVSIEPAIALKDLHPTLRWVEKEDDGPKEPIVEVTIANMNAALRYHSLGFLDGDYAVSIVGTGIRTSVPARIRRLMPGDDARFDVGLVVSRLETKVRVELYDVDEDVRVWTSEEWDLKLDELRYEPSRESLMKHDVPRWWMNAKFGIFIHWGIYSVPGWVPIGYYEEWYHWWIHNPAQPSNILWNYHRNTYGENVVYDDFITGFSGAKFNASQWINLFHDAGAKYFVIVTKHHDGFALFDTEDTTHRSSVHLGPKRDFLGELMSAAKEEHPDMKRGTYYSMPEWFNPAFKKYGFGNWPGGLARNAYNASKWEPYTGYIEGKDYLRDIQEAHMKILAEKYETDIMWCDIGGPNRTIEFASQWYNDAIKQNRQVAMNNRCGVAPDFDTPEYARFSSIQTKAWETNEGIDPYSYGYNRQTRDEDYRSAEAIIHSLVDIVSKNGNYLLNLGPTGEGEIIPAMVERLMEVGHWLSHSGECIYNTTYSFPGAEEKNLRFTTTPEAFCIISFSKPQEAFTDGGAAGPSSHDEVLQVQDPHSHDQQAPWEIYPVDGGSEEDDQGDPFKPRRGHALLVVERPVPILPRDDIYLLGGSGKPLKWKFKGNRLGIFVPTQELDRVSHAWAFKVEYA